MPRSCSCNNSAGSAEIINAVLPTAEPIARGDLVLVGGTDNLCYSAALPNDSIGKQIVRPTAGGPVLEHYQVAQRNIAAVSVNQSAGNYVFDLAKLNNGNFVMAWAAAGEAKFVIVQPDGSVAAQGAVAGALPGGAFTPSVIGLASGGFAIGAVIAASNMATITVFDANGAVVAAPFNVEAGATQIRLAQLVNGNIVSVLQKGELRYAIHSTGGVQIKAPAAIDGTSGSAANDHACAVVALKGGGFVIGIAVYANNTGSVFSQRFDNAGAPAGNPNYLFTGSTTTTWVSAVALAGGGYTVAGHASSVGASFGIYSATGAVLTGPVSLGLIANSSSSYGQQVGIAAAPNGDVGVCCNGATGLLAARYTGAGVTIAAPRAIDGPSSNRTSASISFNADGVALIAASDASSGVLKIYALDATLSSVTAAAYEQSGHNLGAWPHIAVRGVTPSLLLGSPSYLIFTQASSGGPIRCQLNLLKRQAMTLVGVSSASAAANASLSVQITGTAALRQPFKQPWTANQQDMNPPGQRMYAIGYTAVMSGIQAAANTSTTQLN